jgi:predicted small metal-binding protein
MKQLAVVIVMCMFVIAGVSTAAAQDHGKMGKSKETAKTDASMGALKSLSCGSPCDFAISSRDEGEIVSVARDHIKKHHNMSPSDKEIKEMIKPEQMKKDAMPKK